MKRRAFVGGLLLAPLGDATLAANPPATLQETLMFADRVSAGTLPPVARRILQHEAEMLPALGKLEPSRQPARK